MRVQHQNASGAPRMVLPVGKTKAFPPDLSQVATARDWAVSASLLSGDDADTLRLLTSELCSNAMRHTRGRFDGYTVAVDHCLRRVRVTVTDSGPLGSRTPQSRPTGPDDVTGRGLSLVRMLAHTWGADHDGGRTRVWFELNTSPGAGR